MKIPEPQASVYTGELLSTGNFVMPRQEENGFLPVRKQRR